MRQGPSKRRVESSISFGELLIDERLQIAVWLGQTLSNEPDEVATSGTSEGELESRAKKCLQNLLNGNGPSAGFLFEARQHGDALLVDGLNAAAKNRQNQFVFGGKVIIDGAEVDFGGGGKMAEGSGAEAVGGEEALGGIENGELGIAPGGGEAHASD